MTCANNSKQKSIGLSSPAAREYLSLTSTYTIVCQSIRLSGCLFVRPSVTTPFHPCVYASLRQSVCNSYRNWQPCIWLHKLPSAELGSTIASSTTNIQVQLPLLHDFDVLNLEPLRCPVPTWCANISSCIHILYTRPHLMVHIQPFLCTQLKLHNDKHNH